MNVLIEENYTVEQRIEQLSNKEVGIALDMLKNKKVPGEDEVILENLKKDVQKMMNKLHGLITNTWN